MHNLHLKYVKQENALWDPSNLHLSPPQVQRHSQKETNTNQQAVSHLKYISTRGMDRSDTLKYQWVCTSCVMVSIPTCAAAKTLRGDIAPSLILSRLHLLAFLPIHW